MIKKILLFAISLHLFVNINNAHGEEITFSKGNMSSVIQGKTIKGEQTYLFHAIQGQETALTFLSLDEDSSFSLHIQNHSQWIQIATNEKHWNGYLPTSQGDLYKVIIKGSKIDAPFELFVGVKPRDKAPRMIDYKEGVVHLSMEKKQKKIDLSDSITGCIMAYDSNPQNRKDATELQLVDSVPIDNHYYLVFLAYSSGNCNVLGQCGAGFESDIIWMELDQALNVTQKKSVSVDGCRYNDSSLISATNPFGANEGYSFTPLIIQDNGFRIKFEINKNSKEEDYAHVQLLYMRNMADIGLQLYPKKKKRP